MKVPASQPQSLPLNRGASTRALRSRAASQAPSLASTGEPPGRTPRPTSRTSPHLVARRRSISQGTPQATWRGHSHSSLRLPGARSSWLRRRSSRRFVQSRPLPPLGGPSSTRGAGSRWRHGGGDGGLPPCQRPTPSRRPRRATPRQRTAPLSTARRTSPLSTASPCTSSGRNPMQRHRTQRRPTQRRRFTPCTPLTHRSSSSTPRRLLSAYPAHLKRPASYKPSAIQRVATRPLSRARGALPAEAPAHHLAHRLACCLALRPSGSPGWR